MIAITCHVGMLRESLTLPVPDMTLNGKPIGHYFAKGSTHGGTPDIDLTTDTKSRIHDSVIPEHRPTDTLALQSALTKLTRNRRLATKVNLIGLIIADEYVGRPGLLGMMFDLGFNPRRFRPVDRRFLHVPREGCAIFLNAISSLRGKTQDFRREAMVTAIHELGHVFNLWHVSKPSFMSPSKRSGVHPLKALNFVKNHREFLHRCSKERHVWPGGSRFGCRDALGPPLQSNHGLSEATTKGALALTLSLSQQEFWPFEPIELDIRLDTAGRSDDVILLPDEIDPGYDRFNIWIEEPNGERRAYRAANHYCTNPRQVEIARNKPFERDVSLFGESGGYTFRMAGTHRIFATLRMPNGITVRSNDAEAEVLPMAPGKSRFESLLSILAVPRYARLLFYRNGNFNRNHIQEIESFCKAHRSEFAAGALHYALGRMSIKTAEGRTTKEAVDKWRSLGRDHLERAADAKQIGQHCRRRASEILESSQS